MSGEHFTGGQMPHEPITRLPEGLYEDVEKNIVYACTDVALRDPETGKIFLGDRQTEPQIGPWLVGGRNTYAVGIDQNAAKQVENDLGLGLSPDRFTHIGTYSTDFPIAAPSREEHGRHTVNAVMLADLKPEEVNALNEKNSGGHLRDEYSGGSWYDPSVIADPESDFPYALKQLMRDLYSHDLARVALLKEAYDEDTFRDEQRAEALRETEERERIVSMTVLFGLTDKQATELEHTAGDNSAYSIAWALNATQRFDGPTESLRDQLHSITGDPKMGDVQISRLLAGMNLTRPAIASDNGPALRAVIDGAVLALDFNQIKEGKLFEKMLALQKLNQSI